MNAKFAKRTVQKVKVRNVGGVLQPATPITLKNQVKELINLQDISNIVVVNPVDGATLIYNAATGTFEVRPYTAIDSGTF